MKKIFYFAAIAMSTVAFAGCTDGKNTGDNNATGDSTATEQVAEPTEAKAEVKPMGSFTSPEGEPFENTEEISYVLYPNAYASAMEKGEDINGKGSVFYKNEVEDFGDKNTKLRGTEVRYPNTLLIPIYKGATAKKGDIVLTWWQTGSGMERAIVTDDSDPTQPKVHYLDLNYKGDGTGFAEKFDNGQLKPNSFVVLKDGEWAPGAPIAVNVDGKVKDGIIIKAVGDKVIYSGFAGLLKEANKSDVKLLPIKPNVNVGDNVTGVFVGEFSKNAKITKYDKNIGRIWLKDERGNESIVNIFEVMK